eukprot:m.29062 g.29062  ORF g.29062 m.29062 type:complete len:166 (-) comp6637_c0_seq2:1043-1540(-)
MEFDPRSRNHAQGTLCLGSVSTSTTRLRVGDALSQVKYGPGSLLDGWYVLFMVGKLVDLAHAREGWAKSLVLRSVDRIIHLARGFDYSWPITYDALTGTAVTGEEASDVYGYLYIMMRVYSLTINATFLNEAKAEPTARAICTSSNFSLYLFIRATVSGVGLAWT